jgi:UPF0755 protein
VSDERHGRWMARRAGVDPEPLTGPGAEPGGGVAPSSVGTRYSGRTPASGLSTGRSVRGGTGGRGRLLRVALFLVVLAAAVLLLVNALLGPAVAGVVRDVAESNPSTMRFGPVADIVKSQLGSSLTDAAGTDAHVVHFQVPLGATVQDVARSLHDQGLLRDPLAFTYLVVTGNLTDQVQAGTYDLNAAMNPAQLIARLHQAPEVTVTIRLREGLRIEQIAAYLQTVGLKMDVAVFYDLATHPTPPLRADYPFLSTLPKGRSLEGYLGAGTFEVYQDVSPEDMVRTLLDQWQAAIGAGPIRDAQAKGENFYDILAQASLIEQEAAVDSERPLIGGVYANRLARGMLLQADPTVIYAWDTAHLRKLALNQWPEYVFWAPIGKPLADVVVPSDLAGFQTYVHAGQIPGPICTPRLSSIEAALAPNTKTGYLYFVAKGDGSHTHAFARTLAEHEANLRKYGYIQ